MIVAGGTLEKLALHRPDLRAWALYDWANSVFFTTIVQVFPIYFVRVAAADLPPPVASARYAAVTTAAVLLVAVVGPVIGALADYSAAKKQAFACFLLLGVCSTALLFFVGRGDWLLGSALLLLANAGVAGTIVFYESFLPHLARSKEMDRLATTGFAAGYVGGGALLALNLAWISLPATFGLASTDAAMRLSFLSASLWWALFSIPFFLRVREPERRLEPGEPTERAPLAAAFKRLRTTFREVRRFRDALFVLLAVVAYNDGISTIIRLGTTYGTEIGIKPTSLIAAVLLIQAIGVPCSLAFGALAARVGTKSAIFVGLAGYTAVALVGYVMTTATHFFVLAVLLGMVQGGTQALSRSLFASMTPRHRSSEFFGFYGVVDKVSGVLGPALFATATALTGSGRLAILALIAFFVVGALLLAQVDVERGRRAAAEATGA